MTNFEFNCSNCQQTFSGTLDYIGATVECPACHTSFVVQAPSPSLPLATSKAQRSKLHFLLFICISSGLLLLVIVFYAGRWTLAKPELTTVAVTPEPVPTVTPAVISEDTKIRVLNFIERGSKLTALTEQGLQYDVFIGQLAELKAAWQTLEIVQWPDDWKKERDVFQSAIEGWNLAKEIWAKEIESKKDKQSELLALASFYGDPKITSLLRTYADSAYKNRGHTKVPEITFGLPSPDDAKRLEEMKNEDKPIYLVGYTEAIKWCFSNAGECFETGRIGIKEALKHKTD